MGLDGNFPRNPSVTSRQLTSATLRERHVSDSQSTSLARTQRLFGHGGHETAWQQIAYHTAVPDPDTGDLIFDTEVAEIPAYTAFTGRKKSERVTARLIVRRVRDLAKPAVVGEQ